MSIRVSTLIWSSSDVLTHGGTTLLVALRMADAASDDGTGIWLSVARLATDLRASRRSVNYALRTLENDGWIVATGQRKGGRGYVTEYRIAIERLAENHADTARIRGTKGADSAPITKENSATVAPIAAENRANTAPNTGENDAENALFTVERVQKTTRKGADIAPEPSITNTDISRERGVDPDSRAQAQRGAPSVHDNDPNAGSPPNSGRVDDGSSGQIPQRHRSPAGRESDGFVMEIGGWEPDNAARASLFRAGVHTPVEPEHLASFTTHYAGRWMTHAEVAKRWTKWMLREQQSRKSRGSKYGHGQQSRASAFADAIGDPFGIA